VLRAIIVPMGSRRSHYRELLADSWRVLGSYGPRSFFIYFLQWAGFYRRLQVYCQPSFREQAPSRISIEIGELREDELADYASLVPDSSLDVIRRRMAQGHMCTTARLPSGELVGVHWSALGRAWIEFMECEIELDDRAGYNYDAFVSNKYRGNAIVGALESYREVKLRAQGVNLVVHAVWSENKIARGRIDKNPAKGSEIGVLHRYGILRWHRNRLELYPSKYRPIIRLVSNSGV
jgi:hypothetical protein